MAKSSTKGAHKKRGVPTELREFLSAFPPTVTELFLAARRVVLSAAPDANELVYDAYNAVTSAYTFSARLKDAFCHVAAYSSHGNLGFNRGAELTGPTGSLLGSGAKIRHVRIITASDLRAPAMRSLLRAAVLQGRGWVVKGPAKPTSSIRPTTGRKRRPAQ